RGQVTIRMGKVVLVGVVRFRAELHDRPAQVSTLVLKKPVLVLSEEAAAHELSGRDGGDEAHRVLVDHVPSPFRGVVSLMAERRGASARCRSIARAVLPVGVHLRTTG